MAEERGGRERVRTETANPRRRGGAKPEVSAQQVHSVDGFMEFVEFIGFMGLPSTNPTTSQTRGNAELKEPNKPKELNKLNRPRPFSCRNLLKRNATHPRR